MEFTFSQMFIYIACFISVFNLFVSGQSIRVNERTITGKVGDNINLRWTFDILSPNTTYIAAIDLVLGDEYNLDRLLFKNITPVLQPFGNKTFGNRISASFSDNNYTVRLNEIKSNESSSFFLHATIERIATGNRSSSLQVSAVIDLMVENNTEDPRDVKPIPITAEGESNTKLIIIVASCAGGFLLVFLIFIQICLKTRRARRRRNAKPKEEISEANPTDGSMDKPFVINTPTVISQPYICAEPKNKNWNDSGTLEKLKNDKSTNQTKSNKEKVKMRNSHDGDYSYVYNDCTKIVDPNLTITCEGDYFVPLEDDSDSEDYYNHDMSKFKEEMSQKNESSQDRYIPMKSSVDEVQIIENKNMTDAMKLENPYVNESSSSSHSNEDKVAGAGVYYNNNASNDDYLYSEEGKSENNGEEKDDYSYVYHECPTKECKDEIKTKEALKNDHYVSMNSSSQSLNIQDQDELYLNSSVLLKSSSMSLLLPAREKSSYPSSYHDRNANNAGCPNEDHYESMGGCTLP